MTNKGRPKGSKNKMPKYPFGSSKRNPMHVFLRELPKEEYKNAVNLSELTGIGIKKIVGDAMAEGLAVLRTEVYADLIRFNERRGKVIHEKDLDSHRSGTEEIRQLEITGNANERTEQTESKTDPIESNLTDNHLGAGHVYLGAGSDSRQGTQPSDERFNDAAERSGLGSEIVKMSGGAEEESGQ